MSELALLLCQRRACSPGQRVDVAAGVGSTSAFGLSLLSRSAHGSLMLAQTAAAACQQLLQLSLTLPVKSDEQCRVQERQRGKVHTQMPSTNCSNSLNAMVSLQEGSARSVESDMNFKSLNIICHSKSTFLSTAMTTVIRWKTHLMSSRRVRAALPWE